MTDTVPDRLSTDPNSPHFDEELLRRGVGIRFKGQERRDVEEYCISENWIRVQVGKTMDQEASNRPSLNGLRAAVEQLLRSGTVNYRVLGDVTVSTPLGSFTRPYDRTGHFTSFGGAR